MNRDHVSQMTILAAPFGGKSGHDDSSLRQFTRHLARYSIANPNRADRLRRQAAGDTLLETRWQDEKAAFRFREAIPENPLWRFAPHREGSTRAQLLRADSPEALDRLAAAVASEGLRGIARDCE